MVGVGSVVALKPAAVSKSRLGALVVPLRERLARCMALDTLTALAAATDRLVVVSDDPTLSDQLASVGIDATVVAEPSPDGMNAALSFGDRLLRDRGCGRVLASVGDLPALTGEAVGDLLARTADLRRAFVPDHTGYGTTMLIAPAGELNPRFQGASAAAHSRSGAVPVEAIDPRLRSDVDAVDDLAAVIALGVGRHTARLVAGDRLGSYLAATVADPVPQGSEDYVVISDSGVRARLPAAALDGQIRFLRSGQRLHAVWDRERPISAWL
ncbi:2-phospho-L-lactate guanylyltransferase [Microlunatus sp. Gsoil 973]|uniref:2-phospho-L-lactate guanylyltransferase n=1 Tax=Microlunatus sp. Gsoil 973 TaxID=2672569 RepID=UPI0012B4A6A9|nr:2-phospho-L-lactate guanylyltransferase [Microlunatus sp. Gsoil 973]QGN33091.1 2-phospho-L-lactate guanylyltransferase [Microlunatus sp. Gsoil 973]